MYYDPTCEPVSAPVSAPVVIPNPIAQHLRKAAALLKVRGHTKNQLESMGGRLCLIGALWYAGGCKIEKPSTEDELIWCTKALMPNIAEHHKACVAWNDNPHTTSAMVIRLLEETAARLEQT